ncbi:hypothetical protein Syun_027406 [Stephania yunnanensis]|uniref:Uncharacterized protein n=1 Tax=Stephania yunnanensis TaxID=152371 RepID=A0AAP0EHV8_9MAGN
MSAAPITQGRSALTIQDSITAPTVPIRLVIDERVQVRVERVPPTPDTSAKDTLSTPTYCGVMPAHHSSRHSQVLSDNNIRWMRAVPAVRPEAVVRGRGQGRSGGKAGEGSTVASRVEAAAPEWKHPTSSNHNKKMDQNNPPPKQKRAKQANESDVQRGETGMEYGGATFSVRDSDGLTPEGDSREGTKLSNTLTDGVGSEDNDVDIEGADSPSTSSHAEDETTTSFPGGPTTLELLPSFCLRIPQMHQPWFSSFNLADYPDTLREGKGEEVDCR